jgi:hypothetical protein
MLKAFAYRFNLIIDPLKILIKDTGESINVEMLNAIDKNLQKGQKQLLFTKKVKESSSYIISFNMQGLRHGAHTVRDYCKLRLPPIIGLQEVKSTPGTRLNKALNVRGYKLFQNNEDTAVLVREDIKVLFKGRIADLDLPHDLIRIKTIKGVISFLNIYARNRKLRLDHLEICERLGKNAIIVGDFNAKHPSILPHSQKKAYNHNGLVLYRYLSGREVSLPDIVIHNRKTLNEWTHAVGQYWSQIDLIITPQHMEGEIRDFIYVDELVSDHKGVAIYTPGLFKPKEKFCYFDGEEYDHGSFEEQSFLAITQAEHSALIRNSAWYSLTAEEQAEKFNDVIGNAMRSCMTIRKRSRIGNVLPSYIREMIKKKRKKTAAINLAHSETRKRKERKEGKNNKLLWDDVTYKTNMKKLQNSKKEKVRLTRKIKNSILEIKQSRYKKALQELGEIDPRKENKEFWKKLNRLNGGNFRDNGPTSIKYKEESGETPKEIADIFAKYYRDTFQPLLEDGFDLENIAKVERDYQKIRSIWNLEEQLYVVPGGVPIQVPHASVKENVANWDYVPPNPTKHQQENWDIPNTKFFKSIKDSLPEATNLELELGDRLKDIHTTNDLKLLKFATTAPFSLEELEKVIRSTKRKAPGADEIFITQYKTLSEVSKTVLLGIYNRVWLEGLVPPSWKKSILVPILKKGKTSGEVASYRPISLLPVIGKIFESLTLPRLVEYFGVRNLIPCFQMGFRKGKSTSFNIRALFNSSYYQSVRAGKPRPTLAVFFDAKKAFDTVWHPGLICKMASDGIPAQLIRLFGSWLENRSLKVRIGKEFSGEVPLQSGVPQGSVISPLLWNYWIGDCPKTKHNSAFQSFYADDLSLWVSHVSGIAGIKILNDEIKRLVDWTKRKRLYLEPSKSHALVFHREKRVRNNLKAYPIWMDEERCLKIGWVQEAVLLGIKFSENGKFDTHFQEVTKRANAKIRALWKFNKTVKGDTLYNVYKAAIEPVMLYGTEAIYESNSELTSKKLLSVEYNAVRTAYGLKKDATKIECLKHFNNDSVCTRIHRRRLNFVKNNFKEPLIRHTESYAYSQGRNLGVKRIYYPPGTPKTFRTLAMHYPRLYFSHVTRENCHLIQHHNRFNKWEIQAILELPHDPEAEHAEEDYPFRQLAFAPSQNFHESFRISPEEYMEKTGMPKYVFDRLFLTQDKDTSPLWEEAEDELPPDSYEYPMRDSIWAFNMFEELTRGAKKKSECKNTNKEDKIARRIRRWFKENPAKLDTWSTWASSFKPLPTQIAKMNKPGEKKKKCKTHIPVLSDLDTEIEREGGRTWRGKLQVITNEELEKGHKLICSRWKKGTDLKIEGFNYYDFINGKVKWSALDSPLFMETKLPQVTHNMQVNIETNNEMNLENLSIPQLFNILMSIENKETKHDGAPKLMHSIQDSDSDEEGYKYWSPLKTENESGYFSLLESPKLDSPPLERHKKDAVEENLNEEENIPYTQEDLCIFMDEDNNVTGMFSEKWMTRDSIIPGADDLFTLRPRKDKDIIETVTTIELTQDNQIQFINNSSKALTNHSILKEQYTEADHKKYSSEKYKEIGIPQARNQRAYDDSNLELQKRLLIEAKEVQMELTLYSLNASKGWEYTYCRPERCASTETSVEAADIDCYENLEGNMLAGKELGSTGLEDLEGLVIKLDELHKVQSLNYKLRESPSMDVYPGTNTVNEKYETGELEGLQWTLNDENQIIRWSKAIRVTQEDPKKGDIYQLQNGMGPFECYEGNDYDFKEGNTLEYIPLNKNKVERKSHKGTECDGRMNSSGNLEERESKHLGWSKMDSVVLTHIGEGTTESSQLIEYETRYKTRYKPEFARGVVEKKMETRTLRDDPAQTPPWRKQTSPADETYNLASPSKARFVAGRRRKGRINRRIPKFRLKSRCNNVFLNIKAICGDLDYPQNFLPNRFLIKVPDFEKYHLNDFCYRTRPPDRGGGDSEGFP